MSTSVFVVVVEEVKAEEEILADGVVGVVVDVGVAGGRKMPLWPIEEMCREALSRLVSIRRLPAPCGVGFDWWLREDGGILQPIAMPDWVEKCVSGVFGECAEGEGFPCRRRCFGESWKRHGRRDQSCGLEVDFQGCGRYAPRVIMFCPWSSSDGFVIAPWMMSSDADCQVRTWCEKEVREEPCAAVEKTGCKHTPLRMKLMSDDVEERKKDRWERRLELRIEDSKLPGSMTDVGGGVGLSSIFSGASA